MQPGAKIQYPIKSLSEDNKKAPIKWLLPYAISAFLNGCRTEGIRTLDFGAAVL